jgi:hypothetical protein
MRFVPETELVTNVGRPIVVTEKNHLDIRM